MFIVLCAGVVPSLIIARGIGTHRPFGDQLRGGIAVTAAGSILSALLTSVLIGGNIVDWLYSLLSQSLNTLLNKKNFSFADCERILDTMGYTLDYHFTKK